MDSIKEIYKIGFGPSSSHTMGPFTAAENFKKESKNAHKFIVELYGSLAATGKGHLTDYIIKKSLDPKEITFIWKPEVIKKFHTNAIKFIALDQYDNVSNEKTYYSIGGGSIVTENEHLNNKKIYPLNKMNDIIKWSRDNHQPLFNYVYKYDHDDIIVHLEKVFDTMIQSVESGLSKDGDLPGTLKYPRKAKSFYERSNLIKDQSIKNYARIFAYSLAVSEENSAGCKVVTAPTCGSAGVIPGILYFYYKDMKLDKNKLINALAIGGLIGNLIKHNASISGAEVGCQGEIGSACSMASGMVAFFLDGSTKHIEYAAEMGMEHHLGLTCDPVGGYVQIPCIERNAMAASRALDTGIYTVLTDGTHRVSLDQVIQTMNETGKDLKKEYRETSLGGLAKL